MSTNVSSKLATVDALKHNTSEELSSPYQFSNIKAFLGQSLYSPVIFHVKSHQNKEQIWNCWCWIAIKDMKIKETWLGQTINNESWKFPLLLKCYILILCVEYLSGCFSQQPFLPHLGHWTPSNFPFAFVFQYQGKWSFLVV